METRNASAGARMYEILMRGSSTATCLHCLIATFERFPIASRNLLIERAIEHAAYGTINHR
ncbi:MAG TPA: hypothetical protein VFQ23_15590 [Anaerolineales bacterium]|nr:hypothetical protein [Anaerolineales bacterium]